MIDKPTDSELLSTTIENISGCLYVEKNLTTSCCEVDELEEWLENLLGLKEQTMTLDESLKEKGLPFPSVLKDEQWHILFSTILSKIDLLVPIIQKLLETGGGVYSLEDYSFQHESLEINSECLTEQDLLIYLTERIEISENSWKFLQTRPYIYYDTRLLEELDFLAKALAKLGLQSSKKISLKEIQALMKKTQLLINEIQSK